MLDHLILIFTLAFLPLPSVAMAVILTVLPFPAFLAVTLPLLVTDAYLELLLVHRSVLFAPLEAVTFALSFVDFPGFMERLFCPEIATFFTTPFMHLIL